MTWGAHLSGGDSGHVLAQLQDGVIQIVPTSHAFAAVKEDGSVATWGNLGYGKGSQKVQAQLQGGVMQISSTECAQQK